MEEYVAYTQKEGNMKGKEKKRQRMKENASKLNIR